MPTPRCDAPPPPHPSPPRLRRSNLFAILAMAVGAATYGLLELVNAIQPPGVRWPFIAVLLVGFIVTTSLLSRGMAALKHERAQKP